MTQELFDSLDALCMMWSQYCEPPYGHMCMSAGETTADVLDKYSLLKNDTGYGGEVDWDKLEELRTKIQTT